MDDPLLLVLPEGAPVGAVVRELLRIGFDRVAGVLAGGFEAWQNAGREIHRLKTLSTPEVEAALQGEAPALDSEPLTRHGEPPTPHGKAPARLLDVRPPGESAEGMVPGAEHLFVGESQARLAELPRDRKLIAMGSVGHRGGIATELLRHRGLEDVANYPGGYKAWQARHASDG